MLEQQCKYNAMLGKYRDWGYSIKEEDDPICDDDKRVVVSFQGKRIATYYRSKLMLNPCAVDVLQHFCSVHWHEQMMLFN